MIFFENPTYLHALWGLMIPLVVHLWNRRQASVIKVGSVDWLPTSESSRANRLRFQDFWQFLLRCALVIVLSLLLAEPVWQFSSPKSKQNHWILLDPRVDPIREAGLNTDSLRENQIELRWLLPHFPKYNPEAPLASSIPPDSLRINYWSLLQDIPTLPSPPDSLTIYTRGYLANFRGPRPSLPTTLFWKIIPDREPSSFLFRALALSGDSVKLIWGQSEESALRFTGMVAARAKTYHLPEVGTIRREGDSLRVGDSLARTIAIQDRDTLDFLILYEEELEKDRQYVQAALEALGEFLELPFRLEVQQSISPSSRFYEGIFYLKTDSSDIEKLPEYRCLFLFQEKVSSTLFEKGVYQGKVIYFLRKRLDSEANPFLLEQATLPETIYDALFPREALERELADQDRRKMPQKQIEAIEVSKKGRSERLLPQPYPLENLLWMLLFLLFCAERYVSYQKKS